ncbi:prolyl oligopeptidase family serine peptidase [Caenimonas terrae]|uniref:Prolyl oligopeptidase family serine peptidase n=1 Tax=Caenimonas terrae TaxID=696074 RepID=A0ABW0NEE4_9BURK
MKSLHSLLAAGAAALMLASCGGGSGDAGSGGTPAGPPAPRPTGTLLQDPPAITASLSAGDLSAQMRNGPARDQTLLLLAGEPICDVQVRYLQYATTGGAGEATTASAALMTPGGSDSRCTGARPILLYAHATHPEKSFNLARLTDNTNPAYTEALSVAAIFAARGYIVVAPNDAGYDSSTLGYHPFLNAQQQSSEMLDAMAAARTAMAGITPQVVPSTQLFLTGYSQGGYVALATERALEAAGVRVTASAPMSGPYAVLKELDDNFAGRVHVASTLFASLLATSYQRAYGNVYATPADLYESNYVTGIESLLPGTDTTTLSRTGKLPESALFSATPPQAPAGSPASLQATLNAWTPPTNTGMDAIFARGFGPGNLFTNSFRLAYLQDLIAHPADPAFGLRVDAKANDLRGFIPKAPVLLCGGSQDATVSYDNNTRAMAQSWNALVPPRVLVLDVDDSSPSTADPFFTEKVNFTLLKEATRLQARASGDDPDWTLARNYHAAVFPFCASAVGKFFARF